MIAISGPIVMGHEMASEANFKNQQSSFGEASNDKLQLLRSAFRWTQNSSSTNKRIIVGARRL
jgi:hypothetical protein